MTRHSVVINRAERLWMIISVQENAEISWWTGSLLGYWIYCQIISSPSPQRVHSTRCVQYVVGGELTVLTSFLSVVVQLKRAQLNDIKDWNIQFFDVKTEHFNVVFVFSKNCGRNNKTVGSISLGTTSCAQQSEPTADGCVPTKWEM